MGAKGRILNLGLVFLVVLATLLSASVTSVQAGKPYDTHANDDPPNLPGHWHGSPDPDDCNSFNDCIYIFTICYGGNTQTLGSHDPSQLQHQVLVDLIGAKFGACVPAITHSGRCKLTDIDSKVYLGSAFTATWLGRINSLRFRNSDGVIVFVSPIPDTAYFADGKAHALFSLSDPTFGVLLAPGKYKVSCFGEAGTVGEEIRVTVSK